MTKEELIKELKALIKKAEAEEKPVETFRQTSGFKLGSRSKGNLEGVHPDLVKVVELAIKLTKQDFTVIEGKRSLSRQRELVAAGVSETMNSRHLTGHAVDIAPHPIPGDWTKYKASQWGDIARAMKEASEELGVELDWGYDLWGWDKPHYQLDWGKYPK